MRRDFILPESDVEFLNKLGLEWETLKEVNRNWVIIHRYPVPKGYNVSQVSVALLIAPGYPTSQIDMAYFLPHLQRLDHKKIGALAIQMIETKQYQRWSRHRTAANPWRPGIDELSTHMQLVDYWFERELLK
jgi:hypothetical protein